MKMVSNLKFDLEKNRNILHLYFCRLTLVVRHSQNEIHLYTCIVKISVSIVLQNERVLWLEDVHYLAPVLVHNKFDVCNNIFHQNVIYIWKTIFSIYSIHTYMKQCKVKITISAHYILNFHGKMGQNFITLNFTFRQTKN